MPKNISQLLIGAIVLLAVGFYFGKNFSGNKSNTNTNSNTQASPVDNTKTNQTPKATIPINENNTSVGLPQKVLNVWQYVKEHGTPMDGYVGGRTFGNYEHRLPETDDQGNAMHYQEWDVNPKIEGQNRGTERLITSADGRAWYTGDHYQTFIEIK